MTVLQSSRGADLRAIEPLQERRTVLIAAAVTGKIDVRRIAPSVT